jgi:cytidine deaminase
MIRIGKRCEGEKTLPEMQKMQPCARCEQELPESFFPTRMMLCFCKRCQAEVNELLRKKYSVIEAAHIRAQLRRTYKQLRKK